MCLGAPIFLYRFNHRYKRLEGAYFFCPCQATQHHVGILVVCQSKFFKLMLTDSSRLYISSTSFTVLFDHNRSAIAAVRGQIRESIVSGLTHSPHIVASPPRMCLNSCSVRLASGATGSTL